jgi:hypothetical protein
VIGLVRSSVRRPHAVLAALAVAACAALCASCSRPSTFISNRGVIDEGREAKSSAAFAMNGKPVRLELYVKVEGSSVKVDIDHPDGRTTERLEVPGPGIRELCKDFPKEPGSWGLRLSAYGGSAVYWVALHDRKGYVGPDDEARRLVEGD